MTNPPDTARHEVVPATTEKIFEGGCVNIAC